MENGKLSKGTVPEIGEIATKMGYYQSYYFMVKNWEGGLQSADYHKFGPKNWEKESCWPIASGLL